MISTPTLLFTLPLTSPLLPTLLSSHRPFARPSLLPQSQATKWIQRVNAAIISREPAQLAAEERKAAVGLAGEVVRQDGEGWAVAGWGKGWMGAALGMIHVSRSETLPCNVGRTARKAGGNRELSGLMRPYAPKLIYISSYTMSITHEADKQSLFRRRFLYFRLTWTSCSPSSQHLPATPRSSVKAYTP